MKTMSRKVKLSIFFVLQDRACPAQRKNSCAGHFFPVGPRKKFRRLTGFPVCLCQARRLERIRLTDVIKNDIHHRGREVVATVGVAEPQQLLPQRTATPKPRHQLVAGIGRRLPAVGKIEPRQFLFGHHAAGHDVLPWPGAGGGGGYLLWIHHDCFTLCKGTKKAAHRQGFGRRLIFCCPSPCRFMAHTFQPKRRMLTSFNENLHFAQRANSPRSHLSTAYPCNYPTFKHLQNRKSPL